MFKAFIYALPNTEYSRLFPTVPHKPQNKSPVVIPINGYTFICFNFVLNSILDNAPFISLYPEHNGNISNVIIINIPLLSNDNYCIFPPFLIIIFYTKIIKYLFLVIY